MHIFDPNRPRLGNQRLAFLNANTALGRPEIMPSANESGAEVYEFGLWLPISGHGYYASTYCAIHISADEIVPYLRDFAADPEGFCEQHFSNQIGRGRVLDLRNHRQDISSMDDRQSRKASVATTKRRSDVEIEI